MKYENTVEKKSSVVFVFVKYNRLLRIIPYFTRIIVHILETSKFCITFHIKVIYTDPAIVVYIVIIFNPSS